MFALANTLAAAGFVPARINLEAAMLDACRAAGASAWYVADDYLTLGPELVGVPTASVAGTLGYFYSDFSPVVGKSYQITYQYSVTGGSNVQMSLGGSNVPSSPVGSGTVVYTITATNTNPLRCYSNNATAALSGISVKEVVSAKDFQDSAGTLPSYLGGTVGLGFDSAGTVGAELIPTYDFTSGSWSVIGTPSGVTPNGFTNASGTTAGLVIAAASVGLVQGKTYRISIPYSKSESASSLSVRIAAGTDVASASASSGVITGVATSGSTGLQLRYANNGTVTFGAISVKEISGNHVTQATAGNRPTVTRIPRKLGPELFQSVVISGANATNTGSASGNGFTLNQVDTSSIVAATIGLSAVSTAGKSYYITSTPSGLSGNGFKVDNTAWTPAPAQVTAGFTITATGTPSAGIYIYRNTAPAAGTFSNISVREVLEWSYALTFDGTNDSLSAPASIIGPTLTQPYTMISWCRIGAIGSARAMQGDSARWAGVSVAGKPVVVHGGAATKTGMPTFTQGQLVVFEATFDGANVSTWINGVKDIDQSPTTAPTTAAAAHSIGSPGVASSYYNEAIGGCVVAPAVMTDAQRSAVRKFAAAQLGLSL